MIGKPKLKHISQKKSSDQRQRRSVGPHDRDVGQQKEPCADKTMVIIKGGLNVAEGTSGIRTLFHQAEKVDAYDQHDNGTEQKTNHGTQRSCNRQKNITGHHERAPAYSAAQRQSPCPDRCNTALQRTAIRLATVVFHFVPSFS